MFATSPPKFLLTIRATPPFGAQPNQDMLQPTLATIQSETNFYLGEQPSLAISQKTFAPPPPSTELFLGSLEDK
jgi:hypothetical protein